MKKLLVAGLVLTVAGSALAATPQPSLDKVKHKPVNKNLSSNLVRHESSATQPAGDLLGRQKAVKAPSGMTFATPLEAEYHHLKETGQPIPAWMVTEIFGTQPEGGSRQGGETFASATAITFQAGGTYTDSGTTVGSVDDILTNQTPPAMCNTSFYATSSFGAGEVVYTFTLPAAYEVSATVCNNASYDSCLGIFNASQALVAVNDDGAGCTNWSSQIDPCCLQPGTYYIVVDGYGTATGTYTLTVNFGATPCEVGDPCEDATVLGCGDSVTGTTVGGTNYVGNGAPDVFYELEIGEAGPVTLSLCNGTDYDSYLRVYDACPTEGGVELASNDDACGLQSEITMAMEATTYWVVVEGFGTGAGNYTLDVVCVTCDEITCVGDDEGEPNNGPADFGGDDTYGSIECGLASTVCGTTWADGGTRDTDWFELLLLEPSFLTITSEVELFDALIFVIDANYNLLYTANDLGFCEGETISTDCLPAGTYYLWMGHAGFEGVPDEVDYAMTLSCEACEYQDPCDAASVMECGETVTGDNTMSVGDQWQDYCFGGEDGPEVVYSFEHAGGYIELTLASDGVEDLDMALLGSCDPLDCLDMPYAVGSDETISGVYAAGTYYVVVDAWGYTGSDYTFTLSLFCGDDPCENIPPVECDGTPESEPNEGWNDENASYGTITAGETVCGTTWATGGNRDLDWFRYEHSGGDIEILTQIEQFDCILFLTDFAVGGAIIASADASPMCVAETMTVTGLAAGEYYVVIAHNDFEGVDEDQDYALTLLSAGDPCEGHEPITCDGTPESEPNEGWNDENASYGEIAEDETVCGSVWADAGSRDLDWFHFTVPGDEPMNVHLEAEVDEFDAIVFLLDFEVNGSTYTAADLNPACTGEVVNYECLNPGDYFAVIAHNDFEGVPEDQNYSLTLTLAPCTPPDPCEGIINGSWTNGYYNVTNHSAPTMNHHNAVNGCDGISSAGYDHLHMLTLAQPADIRFTMTGQGMADEAIYVLTDCNFTESCIAAMDNGPSDLAPEILEVADMPAGTYYFVADYWGASETHNYSMQVRNLTIAVDENGQPYQFELQGAFPNPFNPTTTIRWTQPELMPANLAIYNIAGQLVQQIDLGWRGPGVHNFVWDASQLSSGVYFTALTTGGQTLTQKVALLK